MRNVRTLAPNIPLNIYLGCQLYRKLTKSWAMSEDHFIPSQSLSLSGSVTPSPVSNCQTSTTLPKQIFQQPLLTTKKERDLKPRGLSKERERVNSVYVYARSCHYHLQREAFSSFPRTSTASANKLQPTLTYRRALSSTRISGLISVESSLEDIRGRGRQRWRKSVIRNFPSFKSIYVFALQVTRIMSAAVSGTFRSALERKEAGRRNGKERKRRKWKTPGSFSFFFRG